jgi:3-hydroxyisobutyrate dehydrogenase-like beta-hydroxyacid dehydrogenase
LKNPYSIFEVLGKLQSHVEPGVASSAKLSNKPSLGLNLQGLAETILLQKKNVSKEDAELTS